MANTYSWEWISLTRELGPDSEGCENIVTHITWSYHVTSESLTKSRINGYTKLQREYGEGFIKYEDITEEILHSWVTSNLPEGEDVDSMQVSLDDAVYKLENPVTDRQSIMPWEVNDDTT